MTTKNQSVDKISAAFAKEVDARLHPKLIKHLSNTRYAGPVLRLPTEIINFGPKSARLAKSNHDEIGSRIKISRNESLARQRCFKNFKEQLGLDDDEFVDYMDELFPED